jgi:hypothetical protein
VTRIPKAGAPGRKATTVKKHFGDEYLFEFIWNNCDREGLWDGDAGTVAEEFGVSEDEAYSAISDLCDRGLIEKLGADRYIITRWVDRNVPCDEDQQLLC